MNPTSTILTAVVISGLVAVLATVAVANSSATPARTDTVSKADMENLLAKQRAAMESDWQKDRDAILASIPAPSAGQPAQPAPAPAAGDAVPKAEYDKLVKEVDGLKAHLAALESQFSQYQAEESKRLEGIVRDRGENLMQQGQTWMNQMQERAPQMMNQQMERLKTELELSDDQMKTMQGVFQNSIKSYGEMAQKLMRGELKREDAQKEMQKIQEDADAQMKSTLTPQQYEKLQQRGGANFWRQGMGGGQGGGNPFRRPQGGQGQGGNGQNPTNPNGQGGNSPRGF